jgi:hypothetical protein
MSGILVRDVSRYFRWENWTNIVGRYTIPEWGSEVKKIFVGLL